MVNRQPSFSKFFSTNKINNTVQYFTRVHFDPAEAIEAVGAAAVPAVTAGGCCELEAAAEAFGPTLSEVTESVTVLLLLLLPLPELEDVELVVEAAELDEAEEEDLLECLAPVLLTFEVLAAFLLLAISLSRDPDPPPDEAEALPERWDDDLLSLAINGGLALLCSPPEKVNKIFFRKIKF